MYWLWYMIGNRLGYIKKVRMEYLPHILKTADILEQAGIKTGVKWDKKHYEQED